jgi:hypothetical protein
MLRNKALWVVGFLFVAVWLFPGLSFSAPEQRLALLIGNGSYSHGGSLSNPVGAGRAKAMPMVGGSLRCVPEAMDNLVS